MHGYVHLSFPGHLKLFDSTQTRMGQGETRKLGEIMAMAFLQLNGDACEIRDHKEELSGNSQADRFAGQVRRTGW